MIGIHDSYPKLSGIRAPLLCDSCHRCTDLSRDPAGAVLRMEAAEFAAAWERALAWNAGRLTFVTAAEIPVLRVFLSFTSQFAKRGIPWGAVPAGEKARVPA